MCFQIIFTTVALNLGEQTWASATHRATNSRRGMIAGHTNPATRVSDIMGWRLDLINKLKPPACAAQHLVYYCGNRNALDSTALHWIANI